MKNKKKTFAFYQIYENDALKDYLEHMALKGWRLVHVGQLRFSFEACEPHPIRYCVEVMEKPSVYASTQTAPLKRYREFCQEAGWDYVGNNGYLHIFCTEDMDALPVETDVQERYERILKASRAGCRTMFLVFLIVIFADLWSCYIQKTLLCPSGFVILVLLATLGFYLGDYLLWTRRAKASLRDLGTLPRMSFTSVLRKNNGAIALVTLLCAAFFLYSMTELTGSGVLFLIIYLIVYGLIFLFFGFLIQRLRNKYSFSRTTNILIYWGCGFLLFLLILAVFFVIFLFIF